MKIQALAFTLVAGMTMALPAVASDRSDSATFCAAIGLTQANQMTCEKQLTNTTSGYDRKSVQANWVARSVLIDAAARGNMPALGNSSVDGKPGTVYQNNGGFISNRVAADIQRAVNTVLRSPALSQIAAAESPTRRR